MRVCNFPISYAIFIITFFLISIKNIIITITVTDQARDAYNSKSSMVRPVSEKENWQLTPGSRVFRFIFSLLL